MLQVRSLLILLIIAAGAMAGREARSSGGSWQNSGSFGQPSISVARSSSGWSNFGSGTGQEEYGARSNGWSGTFGYGSSRSGNYPSGSSWGARGRSTETTFSANTYKSNGGWSANSGGWSGFGGSSNNWDDSNLGRSNGW